MDQSIFRVLSMLPQRVEDVGHEISSIMISELDGRHVRLKQMSVVENIVLPAFQVFVQRSLPSSFFIAECPPHLVEDLRQKHFMGVFYLEYPNPTNAIHSQAIISPCIYCLSQVCVISSFHQLLELGERVMLKSFLLFPDINCSFQFLFGTSGQHVPHSLNTSSSELVGVHFV